MMMESAITTAAAAAAAAAPPSSLAYLKQSNPRTTTTTTTTTTISFFSTCSSQISITSASLTSLCCKYSPTKQPVVIQFGARHHLKRRSDRYVVNASDAENPPSASSSSSSSSSEEDAEKWVLKPVGDGDSRHIGFKVAMPNAFEIDSSVVTVGRLAEKADVVIPVATVSGLHARIKKKVGCLLVTDLGSTNGTYVDDKRLRSGEVATVSPGSRITFGDTNLAMFRVSKLENVNLLRKPEDSEVKPEPVVPVDVSEAAS